MEEDKAAGQDHLVLVPGFGGFDALGSLRYYHGVTDVLRGQGGPGELLAVHYFPNLPTASVQTRAQQLHRWLEELWDRRIFIEGDRLHLIGHSTGGLDIRQLLMNWRRQVKEGREPPALRLLASVQFLSTPHRGTALASHLSRTRVRRVACRSLLYVGYQALRLMGERGSSLIGHVGQVLMPRTRTADWADAFFDTLRGCHVAGSSLERAHARSSYFNLLRWLLDMGSDFNAITDLDASLPPPGAPASPAHEEEQEHEEDVKFLRDRGIRVLSIVTVAQPPKPTLVPRPVYPLSYFLTALKPPERFRPCKVRELHEPEHERSLQPSDNDGLVNSVSQVWPDAEHSLLVDGDHADVIGHYRSPPTQRDEDVFSWRQYDLLNSPTSFGAEDFRQLWQRVADFALAPAKEAGRVEQVGEEVLELWQQVATFELGRAKEAGREEETGAEGAPEPGQAPPVQH